MMEGFVSERQVFTLIYRIGVAVKAGSHTWNALLNVKFYGHMLKLVDYVENGVWGVADRKQ